MDISIVITAYNYKAYVLESIESCLNQKNTSLEYEVIVVDDGSVDGTDAALAAVEHPRLRKFRIENSGIEQASNFGFLHSKGRYVVRVDADDKLANNYIEIIEHNLKSNPDFDFYYSNYFVIGAHGQIENSVQLPEFSKKEILSRGDFLATGTLYLRHSMEQLHGYSELVKNSGLENYEFILKLILSGGRGFRIPCELFFYRRHGQNISDKRKNQILEYGNSLFSRNGLGKFMVNEFHPYLRG